MARVGSCRCADPKLACLGTGLLAAHEAGSRWGLDAVLSTNEQKARIMVQALRMLSPGMCLPVVSKGEVKKLLPEQAVTKKDQRQTHAQTASYRCRSPLSGHRGY